VTYYVATETGGVYTAASLDDPQNWSADNDGLGDLRCIDLVGYQSNLYVLVDGDTVADRAVYHKYGSGDWSQILTVAQARTLASETDENSTLYDLALDVITGYLYVIFGYEGLASEDVPLRLLRYGDGAWSVLTPSSNDRHRNIGSVAAHNSVVVVGSVRGAPAKRRIYVSPDDGDSWRESTGFDESTFRPWVFINPNGERIYATGGLRLYQIALDGTPTELQEFAGIRPDSIAFVSAGEQYLYDSGADLLRHTSDAWENVDDTDTVQDTNAIHWDTDQGALLFGDELPDPQTLAQWDGDALTGVSGPSPGSAPYTNSIPETAGGVAPRASVVQVDQLYATSLFLHQYEYAGGCL